MVASNIHSALGMDSDRIHMKSNSGSYLSHFNSNLNIVGYEYKMDVEFGFAFKYQLNLKDDKYKLFNMSISEFYKKKTCQLVLSNCQWPKGNVISMLVNQLCDVRSRTVISCHCHTRCTIKSSTHSL